jgi:hypothetical protein
MIKNYGLKTERQKVAVDKDARLEKRDTIKSEENWGLK